MCYNLRGARTPTDLSWVHLSLGPRYRWPRAWHLGVRGCWVAFFSIRLAGIGPCRTTWGICGEKGENPGTARKRATGLCTVSPLPRFGHWSIILFLIFVPTSSVFCKLLPVTFLHQGEGGGACYYSQTFMPAGRGCSCLADLLPPPVRDCYHSSTVCFYLLGPRDPHVPRPTAAPVPKGWPAANSKAHKTHSFHLPPPVGGGASSWTYFIQTANGHVWVHTCMRARCRLRHNSRFNWKLGKSAKIFSGFNFSLFPMKQRIPLYHVSFNNFNFICRLRMEVAFPLDRILGIKETKPFIVSSTQDFFFSRH